MENGDRRNAALGGFGERLAARTALPLTFVDEALTSVEAAARLRAAGVDPRREPERIDALAAPPLSSAR